MTYAVEKLDNEPIIFIRVLAPLNPVEELANLSRERDALAANLHGKIYRIVDWTEAQLTFHLVMELLDAHRKNVAATALRNTRVKNHYVVSGKWDRFIVEALLEPPYGNITAPMFSSLQEAITAVRNMIRRETIELSLR